MKYLKTYEELLTCESYWFVLEIKNEEQFKKIIKKIHNSNWKIVNEERLDYFNKFGGDCISFCFKDFRNFKKGEIWAPSVYEDGDILIEPFSLDDVLNNSR